MSCLRIMNIALLDKWWCKLKVEKNTLWFSCIKAIHDIPCVDGKPFAKHGIKRMWLSIYKIKEDFGELGISLRETKML